MPTSLPLKRSFRAVIFDLDGTLFDSLADLSESMNEVLDSQCFQVHPPDSYRYFVGDGMGKLVIRALPPERRNDRASVTLCLELMRQLYSQRWDRRSTLYAGIPDLLDGLTERQLPLSILSNKPQVLTLAIRDKFLSRWPFRLVLGASAAYPLKPDPAGALDIARELNLPPRDFLYLGDTAVDMQTAREAGMYAIGCLWGFREEAELKKAGAEYLLKRPMELLKLLDWHGSGPA